MPINFKVRKFSCSYLILQTQKRNFLKNISKSKIQIYLKSRIMSLFSHCIFKAFFPHRSHALVVYLHEQVHKFPHVGKKKGLDPKSIQTNS